MQSYKWGDFTDFCQRFGDWLKKLMYSEAAEFKGIIVTSHLMRNTGHVFTRIDE